MAEPIISFIPQNDAEFLAGIRKLEKATNDFKIPFSSISADFYKSNRQIFTLKGPGKYQDLAPSSPKGRGGVKTTSNYKQQKKRRLGFVYPIFTGAKGTLVRSLLNKGDTNASYFLGQQTLIMGTKVKYAIYHQSDLPRKKIPQRKVIFISGGADEIALDSKAGGRLKRWIGIIDSHVEKIL